MLGFAVEGNAPPPKKITSWFLSKGQGKTRDDSADYIPHDIYVIGTQEDPLGEKEWLEILKHSLQEITSMTFKTVSSWPGHWGGLQGSGLCKAVQEHLRRKGGGSACELSTSQDAWCSVVIPHHHRCLPGPERSASILKLVGSMGIAENHWSLPRPCPCL